MLDKEYLEKNDDYDYHVALKMFKVYIETQKSININCQKETPVIFTPEFKAGFIEGIQLLAFLLKF